MSFDRETLLSLLPAIYRIRDQELAQASGLARGPLADLLDVIASQVALLEEDVEQLYDDAFIETCAEWAVPYIGDLVGYRPIHGAAPKVISRRAEVARTVAYRRRKGTATVIEQLAADVTGWRSHVVEFFQRLATTQYMNHPRTGIFLAPDLRRWERLERIGTGFDTIPRTVDVRRIASGRGRHNIPNVGVFVWRIEAHPLSRSPAVAEDDRRFRFSSLGNDTPLYTRPVTEDEITQLSAPINVPLPISRRVLEAHLGDYYGDDLLRKSLRLYVGAAAPLQPVDVDDIRVCYLGDHAGSWAHLPPAGKFAIDPVLGRLALPPERAGEQVEVDFHYGFPAEMGGGEYERGLADVPGVVRVPQQHATVQAAIDALNGNGVVEITHSGRYAETLSIQAGADQRIELRAANGARPTIVLGGPFALAGGLDAEIVLDGLLVAGGPLEVANVAGNQLRKLTLRHCTLVPGLSLDAGGLPTAPLAASLAARIPNLEIAFERCISGAVRVDAGSEVRMADSVLDGCSRTGVAYSADDGSSAGGALRLEACTVIGKVHALKLPLVSNTILFAGLAANEWAAPVIAVRRQEGCMRFSYVPSGSRAPRRYRCVPDEASGPVAPQFTALRYGHPAYVQLRKASGPAILTGAEDEGEMGALHFLMQPQREANLQARLEEYLRVGLEAGIFHDS